MSRRGRVLVLTPRFPYPVVGGDRLRIHAICRALSREHDLTLLSLCESKEEFDPALVSDETFARIERIHLPRWRSLLQVTATLPGRTPLQVAYYRSRAFARRLSALLPQHDLALAHLIRTGDYLLGVDERPTMLEMTDAISMNYARVQQHGAVGLRGRAYAIERARLEAYEKRMPQAFTAVSLIAEGDARYLWGDTLPANLIVASNGVDCDALPFCDRTANRRIAVFIGNMHSTQNMDACRHFVSDILPLLDSDEIEEFRVVGRIRPADAHWLRTHPRVSVTGEIDSVPAAVADARIGVCPVRLGAGVQNKVLEYMALGLPVITSPVGHEGLAAIDGHDLLVASRPEAFADQIRRLNQEDNLFRRLASNGRAFVQERHGWGAVLAPLVQKVNETIAISTQNRSSSSG